MPKPIVNPNVARCVQRLGDGTGKGAFLGIVRANPVLCIPPLDFGKPLSQRGDDRHDAAASCLGVVGFNDDLVFSDVLSFKTADFGAAQPGKAANG